MESDIVLTNCPCCKYSVCKYIILNTDWGLEDFLECQKCGIIFRRKEK